MLRSQAPLVAAAAVSERVSLGLPVSLKQVTKIVRALGAAGDWPALVTLARDIQVRSETQTLKLKNIAALGRDAPEPRQCFAK